MSKQRRHARWYRGWLAKNNRCKSNEWWGFKNGWSSTSREWGTWWSNVSRLRSTRTQTTKSSMSWAGATHTPTFHKLPRWASSCQRWRDHMICRDQLPKQTLTGLESRPMSRKRNVNRYFNELRVLTENSKWAKNVDATNFLDYTDWDMNLQSRIYTLKTKRWDSIYTSLHSRYQWKFNVYKKAWLCVNSVSAETVRRCKIIMAFLNFHQWSRWLFVNSDSRSIMSLWKEWFCIKNELSTVDFSTSSTLSVDRPEMNRLLTMLRPISTSTTSTKQLR
jgi:hypothetical protein